MRAEPPQVPGHHVSRGPYVVHRRGAGEVAMTDYFDDTRYVDAFVQAMEAAYEPITDPSVRFVCDGAGVPILWHSLTPDQFLCTNEVHAYLRLQLGDDFMRKSRWWMQVERLRHGQG